MDVFESARLCVNGRVWGVCGSLSVQRWQWWSGDGGDGGGQQKPSRKSWS